MEENYSAEWLEQPADFMGAKESFMGTRTLRFGSHWLLQLILACLD